MTSAETPSATKVDWRVTLLMPLGLLLLRLLASTWRFEVRNDGGWRALRAEGRNYVLVLWHGTLLPLAYHHRSQGISVLVSEHRDGEIIARVLHALGCRTVRGSTTRGGGRALLSMISELEHGHVVAITPDGPRGPAQLYQPGALIAANRANVPVVPIALRANRAWRLNSWDRFIVPKPFARIIIAYGNPLLVQGGSPREAAADVAPFESQMRGAHELANRA